MKRLLLIAMTIFIFSVPLAQANTLTPRNWGVFYDHRAYDPHFFSKANTEDIRAYLTVTGSNPITDVFSLQYYDFPYSIGDPITSVNLPYHPFWSAYSREHYHKILGTVDSSIPGWETPWEGKNYDLYRNGSSLLIGSQILSGELSYIDIPYATYDFANQALSWNSVAQADNYRIRVIDSSNVVQFQSSSLTGTMFDFKLSGFDPTGFDIRVEARDFISGRLINRGVYYTSAQPVPEPSTMLLLGAGLFGLAGLRRKKRN